MMVIAYVESSAVLSWLFREPTGRAVFERLGTIDRIVTSQLTELECTRAIMRGEADGRFGMPEALSSRQLFHDASNGWNRLAVTQEVLMRAASLPVPTLRALDAIHVASAVILREELGPLTMLTLDTRVREASTLMGLPLFPV